MYCHSSVSLWTVARQVPLSTGLSQQEFWSGLSFPTPGALLYPGIKPTSPALAARFFSTEPPGKPLGYYAKWEKKITKR